MSVVEVPNAIVYPRTMVVWECYVNQKYDRSLRNLTHSENTSNKPNPVRGNQMCARETAYRLQVLQ